MTTNENGSSDGKSAAERPAFAQIDETHDPALESWVESAAGHPDFPIQNLPFCVFAVGRSKATVGIAIGDMILDLTAVLEAGLLSGDAAKLASAANQPGMNAMMEMGPLLRKDLRKQVSRLLSVKASDRVRAQVAGALRRVGDCVLHLPATVLNYTDFYAGIHHARRVGELFRPTAPLMPNYTYVPIGYHGRASTVRVSGTDFARPRGQIRPDGDSPPVFEPTRRLDFELEMGIWLGRDVDAGANPVRQAAESIWGFSLLNDWSARDIQAWEYQPLGPFLSKSFCTTVSPFVVTPEALAPFREAAFDRTVGDFPPPLAYLDDAEDQRHGGLNVDLSVHLSTLESRRRGASEYPLSTSNTRHLFWTFAQLAAHHSSNGCEMMAGDLLGSGTISGPIAEESGSLLELTAGGKNAIDIGGGERRTFLLDGDEVSLEGRASRSGFVSIGFGECRARVASV